MSHIPNTKYQYVKCHVTYVTCSMSVGPFVCRQTMCLSSVRLQSVYLFVCLLVSGHSVILSVIRSVSQYSRLDIALRLISCPVLHYRNEDYLYVTFTLLFRLRKIKTCPFIRSYPTIWMCGGY